LKLLKNETLVKSITFNDAEITIFKKYGQSYGQFLREFFMTGETPDEIHYIDKNNFRLFINKGSCNYIEVLRDDRIQLGLKKINASVMLKNRTLSYRAEGKAGKFKSNEISAGFVSVNGIMNFGDNGSVRCSRNELTVENFDISYANPFLDQFDVKDRQWFGGLSTRARIDFINGNMGLGGVVELNNLNLVAVVPEGSFNYISNENLTVDFTAEAHDDYKKIIVRKLNAHDGNFKIVSRGVLGLTGKDRYVDLVFSTDRINLSRLSDNFAHARNVHYGGFLKADGACSFDLLNPRMGKVALNVLVDDFSVFSGTGRNKKEILRKANVKLSVEDRLVKLDFSMRKDRSDISMAGKSYVKSWSPLLSSSDIRLDSSSLEGALIARTVAGGLDRIFEDAYSDKARGYEDIYFLSKPLGRFMSGNSMNIKISLENILFGRKARLESFSAEAELNDGYMAVRNFAMKGYDAQYGLECYGYFKTEHPSFRVKAEARNFDVGAFYRDTGLPGEMSGIVNVEGEFDVNGYRMSHLLEYGKGSLDIRMNEGRFSGTPLQGALKDFLKRHTHREYSLGRVEFLSATMSITHTGETFYIRNFGINGDTLSFNAYGSYNYLNGLSIPIQANLAVPGNEADPPAKFTIPFSLKGEASRPSLVLVGVKERPELLLFDIN